MRKEAPGFIPKISLEGTENLIESSIITVEIRNGFYCNANKQELKQEFGNKISVSFEVDCCVTISITLCHT